MRGHLHHLSDGVGVGPGHGADVQTSVAVLLHLHGDTEQSHDTSKQREMAGIRRNRTHLRDHPLEDVAAADGLEDLGGDSLGDALEALLHKGFTLQRGEDTHIYFKTEGQKQDETKTQK